jgi:hypothetical protein
MSAFGESGHQQKQNGVSLAVVDLAGIVRL